MLIEAATYDELYRNFRWDIPARFNIAVACCDRHADGTGRLALIYVDEYGATTRTSFDEVAEASRRFANVLKADGLARGDRVAVFLSQSLELPIGAMLRRDQADRAFRQPVGGLHVGYSVTEHCLDEGQKRGDFR